MLLVLARYLTDSSKEKINSIQGALRSFGIVIFPMILITQQPDSGYCLIICRTIASNALLGRNEKNLSLHLDLPTIKCNVALNHFVRFNFVCLCPLYCNKWFFNTH